MKLRPWLVSGRLRCRYFVWASGLPDQGEAADGVRQERPDQDSGEKTVMRPKYSYLGKFEISEKVISDIVGYIVSVTPGVSQVIMAGSSPDEDNNLYIRVIITVEWGSRIRTAAAELQRRIVEEVSRMTNFNINGVSVEVRGFKSKGAAG